MPPPRRTKPPKSLRAARRQRGENDGIAGMTTFFIYPFVQGLVALTMLWLVQMGILASTPAIIIGLIIGSLITPLVFTVFHRQIAGLLNGRTIARPGCLAGLIVYPVCVALAFGVLWYSQSLTMFIFSILAVPLICFIIAFVVTSRTPMRNRR